MRPPPRRSRGRRRQRSDSHRAGHRVRLQLRARGLGACATPDCAPVVVNNNPETVSTDFDISDVLVFEPPGADEVEAAYDATNAPRRHARLRRANGDQSRRRTAPARRADRRQRSREPRHGGGSRTSSTRRCSAWASRGREGSAAKSFRKRARSRANSVFRCSCGRRSCSAAAAWRSSITKGSSQSYVESAPPIAADAPLLVDKYLRGLGSGSRRRLRRRRHPRSRHLRTHRARGHSFGRFDQRLSAANDRRRDGGAHRRGHARDRARTRNSRLDQHPVRHPRRRTLHHRSESARQPHGADHLKSDGHQSRRGGDARRARRTIARHGIRHRDCSRDAPFVVVKVPVFSFAKMRGVETILGPEMKSTGEVLGIDETFAGALRKGFIGCGRALARTRDGRAGRILVSISDEEKAESVPILRRYAALGFTLVATPGTHALLDDAGIAAEAHQQDRRRFAARAGLRSPRARRSRHQQRIGSARESPTTTRFAVPPSKTSIACLTSLDTASALAAALESSAGPPQSLQEYRALAGVRRARSSARRERRR